MTGDERQRLLRLRANLQRRALIYQFTRDFFTRRGFLEIETPVRVPAVAPEVHIVPFDSEGWYLSTSPELYLKRLLAAGYDRLFQISRCFREGERGKWHNPEFTLLEWYRAPGDYVAMLEDTEELVRELAQRLAMGHKISYQDRVIDITPPWPRVTVRNAFLKHTGWDPVGQPDPDRFDVDLIARVVPALDTGRPVILTDYPAPFASLARLRRDNPAVAERAEVFFGELELANAYSELRDPDEQRKRFVADAALIEKGHKRRAVMPARFLEAVGHMPECGGIALGMDRLVMLLCNASSIDEVLAFTVDNA